MHAFRAAAVAALVLTFGCAAVPPAPTPASAPSHDDGDVYAAVFDSTVGPQAERPKLAIHDRTTIARDWVKPEDVHRVLPKASDRLVDDFFARSAVEHPLAPSAFARVSNLTVELLSDEDLKRAFATEFLDQEWARFRDTHPGVRSIVNFSAVGYDDAAHTALVYMDAGCGPSCGAAYLFALERGDNGAGPWRVTDTRLLWAN
jgi:hypothetical protein